MLRSAKRAPANVRRLNNRKWRQSYCSVDERSRALALLNAAQVYSNNRTRPSQMEDNKEIAKIYWRNLKIFFSKTTNPISTNLGPMHPWVKGIQVCSNEGSHSFTKGGKRNRENIYWHVYKFFFSRANKPIST